MNKWIYFSLGMLIIGWFLLRGNAPSSPQEITMTIGSSRWIAGRRAELWLGEIDNSWREDLGHVVDSAQLELRIKNKTYSLIAYQDKMSEPVEGIRVRVVKILDSTPPAVTLKIVW